MKRKGYIYEKIISVDNLTEADRNAQRGKQKQRSVKRHNKKKQQDIVDLNEVMELQLYETGEYHVFNIREPKLRTISRLDYFPHRVVHWGIMLQIENDITRSLISQTYSCIKGRGVHKCLFDIQKAFLDRENTTYCLQVDIRKFFPSVDKTILKKLIRRKWKDQKFLNLLNGIIDSNAQGLPLGNYLSQWLANYYMNGFDHWLKEKKRVKYYFRYCDDFVIFHADKAYLHQLRKDIQEYLQEILHLEFSNYQVYPVESRGVNLVGYIIFHDYVLIRKTIKNSFKRMLRRRRNDKSIASYWSWFKHCNGRNFWIKHVNNEFLYRKTKRRRNKKCHRKRHI